MKDKGVVFGVVRMLAVVLAVGSFALLGVKDVKAGTSSASGTGGVMYGTENKGTLSVSLELNSDATLNGIDNIRADYGTYPDGGAHVVTEIKFSTSAVLDDSDTISYSLTFDGTTHRGTVPRSDHRTFTEEGEKQYAIHPTFDPVKKKEDKKEEKKKDDDDDDDHHHDEPSEPSKPQERQLPVNMTPQEAQGWGLVGKEPATVVSGTTSAGVSVQNAYQGTVCQMVFKLGAPGFSIGRTYNISSADGSVTKLSPSRISLRIPMELQKAGRTFMMVVVNNGQPVPLVDKDTSADTITVDTNQFGAAALMYKD